MEQRAEQSADMLDCVLHKARLSNVYSCKPYKNVSSYVTMPFSPGSLVTSLALSPALQVRSLWPTELFCRSELNGHFNT